MHLLHTAEWPGKAVWAGDVDIRVESFLQDWLGRLYESALVFVDVRFVAS